MAATPDEVSGCGHQAGATEQGAGDQADDGHLSAAGDEAIVMTVMRWRRSLVLNGPRP